MNECGHLETVFVFFFCFLFLVSLLLLLLLLLVCLISHFFVRSFAFTRLNRTILIIYNHIVVSSSNLYTYRSISLIRSWFSTMQWLRQKKSFSNLFKWKPISFERHYFFRFNKRPKSYAQDTTVCSGQLESSLFWRAHAHSTHLVLQYLSL